MDDLPGILHIQLPKDYVRHNMILNKVINVNTEDTLPYISDENMMGSYLDIPTSILDTTSGMHIYRLEFQNVILHYEQYLYFSYIMQISNPENLSYVYMNRKEKI